MPLSFEKYDFFCRSCANKNTEECKICEWSYFDMQPSKVLWTNESLTKETEMVKRTTPPTPPLMEEHLKNFFDFSQTTCQKVAAAVVELKDKAVLKTIRSYVEKEKITECILLDSDSLKEVLILGMEQYKKIHGKPMREEIIRGSDNFEL